MTDLPNDFPFEDHAAPPACTRCEAQAELNVDGLCETCARRQADRRPDEALFEVTLEFEPGVADFVSGVPIRIGASRLAQVLSASSLRSAVVKPIWSGS